MNELVQMCLEDMNKLKRQKVETLVTIHVRQMELFGQLRDLVKDHKIKDTNATADNSRVTLPKLTSRNRIRHTTADTINPGSSSRILYIGYIKNS